LASRLQSARPDSDAAALMDVGEFASKRGIAIHGLRRGNSIALAFMQLTWKVSRKPPQF